MVNIVPKMCFFKISEAQKMVEDNKKSFKKLLKLLNMKEELEHEDDTIILDEEETDESNEETPE